MPTAKVSTKTSKVGDCPTRKEVSSGVRRCAHHNKLTATQIVNVNVAPEKKKPRKRRAKAKKNSIITPSVASNGYINVPYIPTQTAIPSAYNNQILPDVVTEASRQHTINKFITMMKDRDALLGTIDDLKGTGLSGTRNLQISTSKAPHSPSSTVRATSPKTVFKNPLFSPDSPSTSSVKDRTRKWEDNLNAQPKTRKGLRKTSSGEFTVKRTLNL